VCDVVTAVALRPAGRLILVAGMLVAVNPEHGGGSLSHAIWASIGFGGLTFWPAAAWRRGPSVPRGLRPVVCACAVAALVTLTAWFGTEGPTGAGHAGLAERIVGVVQALWLLTGGAVLPLPVGSGHRLAGVGALTGGLSRLVP
jgi:hypothetical protein